MLTFGFKIGDGVLVSSEPLLPRPSEAKQVTQNLCNRGGPHLQGTDLRMNPDAPLQGRPPEPRELRGSA